VVVGAHTPREKTFRPFVSCTTQCPPAAFTRRVRAASPGGRRTQPSGAVRTRPSAARTVSGEGPGAQIRAVDWFILYLSAGVVCLQQTGANPTTAYATAPTAAT